MRKYVSTVQRLSAADRIARSRHVLAALAGSRQETPAAAMQSSRTARCRPRRRRNAPTVSGTSFQAARVAAERGVARLAFELTARKYDSAQSHRAHAASLETARR